MKKEINIRLNANRAKVVNTGYKFSSGDKGIVFKIAVDELDTTGTTAKIVFKRSNGTSVESNITATENVYSYTTLGNELEVVGPVVADVKFYDGGNRVSTSTFIFEVVSDTMDGIGAGTAGYSDTLEQMKESMLQAQEGMNATKGEMETLSSQLETLYDSYAEAFGTTGAFNPKGNYSAEESYTVRDLVTYNGGTWICIKNCTGATPGPDSDCWQYFFSHAEIEAIITGTQQVGNAKTLDGHGAEDFAPFEELAFPTNKSAKLLGTITDISELDSYYGKNGYVATNIAGSYAQVLVMTVGATCMQVYMSTYGEDNRIKKIRFRNATATWSIWFEFTNYLPLTENKETKIKAANSYSNAVSLCSGIANTSYLSFFDNSDVWLGKLGFYGVDNPCAVVNGQAKTLLHTGNKPTGTYTGNGDATERTIATGGIGNVIYITGSGYGVYVDNCGALAHSYYDGTVVALPNKEIKFLNGVLTIATASPIVNNTNSYTYQVL